MGYGLPCEEKDCRGCRTVACNNAWDVNLASMMAPLFAGTLRLHRDLAVSLPKEHRVRECTPLCTFNIRQKRDMIKVFLITI